MSASEGQRLESLERGLGLLGLNRLFPKTHPGLQDLAHAQAAAFLKQFDAEPREIQYYFALLKTARTLLESLCWPAPGAKPWPPGRLATRSAPLALEMGLRPRFKELLEPGMTISPEGIVPFKKPVDLYRFLSRALEWLAQNAPRQIERPGPEPPNEAEERRKPEPRTADRLGALQTQWICDERLRPMDKLIQRLAAGLPPGATPLLFGSLAEDGPWPAYADADLALWLNADAWRDAGCLMATARAVRDAMPLMMHIDPLQHHGPYLLFDFERAAYCESLLPLATLRRATALRGGPLSLACAPPLEDRALALASLVGLVRGTRNLAGRGRMLADRYMAKYITSLVLLAPAAAQGALGEPVEKGESFVRIKGRLGEKALETLEGFERVRREWHWAIGVPSGLLGAAGGRANRLSRNVNRWPSFELARRLRALTPGLGGLFDELVGIVESGKEEG